MVGKDKVRVKEKMAIEEEDDDDEEEELELGHQLSNYYNTNIEEEIEEEVEEEGTFGGIGIPLGSNTGSPSFGVGRVLTEKEKEDRERERLREREKEKEREKLRVSFRQIVEGSGSGGLGGAGSGGSGAGGNNAGMGMFNLAQLRGLQEDLAAISSYASYLFKQVTEEKQEFENWVKVRENIEQKKVKEDSPSKLIHKSRAGAQLKDLDLKSKRKIEVEEHFDKDPIDKKRKVDDSQPHTPFEREGTPTPIINFKLKVNEPAQVETPIPIIETIGEKKQKVDSLNKKKRKNENQKVKRRSGKTVGSKSVSGFNRGKTQDDEKSGEQSSSGAGKSKSSKSKSKSSKSKPPKSNVEPEEEETVKSKVGTQITFETFTKFIEPYVRSLAEEDLTLVEATEDDPYPYVIPPLGKTLDSIKIENQYENETDPTLTILSGFGIGGTPIQSNTLNQTGLNELFCRNVTQRILGCLFDEQLLAAPDLDDDNIKNGSTFPTNEEYESVEERIITELRYVGLLEDEEFNENEREDDEICFQLRSLQDSLRKQVTINNSRKAKIFEKAKSYLAFQEYEQLVSDVHRQIEKIYLSRNKPLKKGKKKDKPKPLPDASVRHLQEADRLLQKLSSVFPRDKYQPPTSSIYSGEDAEPNPNPWTDLGKVAYSGYSLYTDLEQDSNSKKKQKSFVTIKKEDKS